MYIPFVILHVVCAGVWIGLTPVQLVFLRLVRSMRGSAQESAQGPGRGARGEIDLMTAFSALGLVMGNIGGGGGVLSGVPIAVLGHYPWRIVTNSYSSLR